jgi:hypothetical protein
MFKLLVKDKMKLRKIFNHKDGLPNIILLWME